LSEACDGPEEREHKLRAAWALATLPYHKGAELIRYELYRRSLHSGQPSRNHNIPPNPEDSI
jgi:hypothetical protein